jgi:MFS family permease
VLVGALALATRAPSILLAPIAGSLADRYDRQRVAIAANGVQAVAAGALAVLAGFGLAGPGAILGLTLLLGIGFALGLPAQLALIPALAPPERLSQAVSLNSAGINIARLAGPALGGIVLATAGATAGFAVNAASFGVVMIVLATIRPRPATPSRGAGIGEGFRHALSDPLIRRLLVGMAIFTGLASSVQELAPVITASLGGGPVALGMLLGAMGAGALAGVVVLEAVVGRLLSRERALPLATAMFGVLMVALAFAPGLPVALVIVALAGACWIWMFAGTNTGVQLRSPSHMLGRMLGMYQLAVIAPFAVGPILVGAVAQFAGIATALVGAAAILIGWGAWAAGNLPSPGGTDDSARKSPATIRARGSTARTEASSGT